MITVLPAGLAAAPTANQLSLGLNIKERLERPCCVSSCPKPKIIVSYSYDNPTLSGETVFIPITALVTLVTVDKRHGGCCGSCTTSTQMFAETFTVAFQGQTALPTNIEVESVGHITEGSDLKCGKAYSYCYNDSITITLT